MNNKNNATQQKRIFLAVIISFVFFMVYDYFFLPKKPINSEQNTTQISTNESTISNTAPEVKQENTSLPTTNAPISQSQNLVKISSDFFEADIDIYGRISTFYLKDKKHQKEDGSRANLVTNDKLPLPLELRFNDTNINQKAFNTPYISDESELIIENEHKILHLTQNLSDLKVEKIITFYPRGNYEIEIKLSKDTPYFISPGFRPSIAIDGYTVHGALVVDKDEKITTFEDEDVDENEQVNNIIIASAFDRYYASVFYNFDEPLNIVISHDEKENPIIYAQAQNSFKAGGYIGSKEHAVLMNIDKRLKDVIEYGWFTFIARPMFDFLNFLHKYINNWGWAIVVMTLIVRIVLFPLTYKSMMSMNKLKDLAPKMKELKERYKGDPQKMNMHMMELYKKHGANPMSGCLPIFLQIPIFFAIYRVLLNATELKDAPWAFWIHDLSLMDPYFILPILMGVTMFVQQLITPMSIQDPTQAKIMKFLPVIFTFFFLWFPAGLTLYWCVNNLCSLLQQFVINKLFAREHHKRKESE
ncbi:membrane protein insertase YidC [Campylobacter sp. LR196d]|uniref:membrane protein insertase YidC n=1 Tax=Campylobacter sp. LR196d TaxID=2593543 RepID=UPI00123B35D4|nr:membrane protein insertase YidC [Campylobacter sp. LR196d]KAA6227396.1 membrane protein insertase YidC [Campylobacter sp. LR196d]